MCSWYLWSFWMPRDFNITTRVVWDNITNRLFLFNIPVNITIQDIGQELSVCNNIKILELCRFLRKDITQETSPTLLTPLGTPIPLKIKFVSWFRGSGSLQTALDNTRNAINLIVLHWNANLVSFLPPTVFCMLSCVLFQYPISSTNFAWDYRLQPMPYPY